MRRLILKAALAACLIASALALAGCGSSWSGQADQQTVKSRLSTACILSDDELYQRAAAEMSSGATLDFYSTTSIAEKAAANFMEKYPKLAGKVAYHAIEDVDTYDFLEGEISSDAGTVDMMISQNGADLQTRLLDTGIAYRYFPEEYLELVGKDYQLPAAACMANTLFVYNNGAGQLSSSNIWQFTEEQWAGKVYFKNPLDETENINFLVMLTSPEWTAKISFAYEERYGKAWDNGGAYLSASYEWIDRFLKNCDFSHGSNSQICEDTSKTDGVMGLFVYSKVRKLKDDAKGRLTAMAYERDADCFAGYMYATYATVANNTDCPYTCALFINYLLSEEGFSKDGSWNNYQGYYSANSTVVKSADIDDRDFAFWEQSLVVEDSDYIIDNADLVRSFIEERLSSRG